MKTPEIRAALREKFCAPEFGLVEEVRNSTGFSNRVRSADALAMSLWPSRGLQIHGFEIKASRADWLNELKNPAKAEEIARYCHFWWLVVGDPKIVKEGELPKNWGLIVPRGEKLVVKVQAPELEPQQVSYQFLAALFRKVSEAAISPEAHQAAINKARAEGLGAIEQRHKHILDHKQREIDDLKETVREFEEASGIDMRRRWRGQRIGEAVRFVLSGGLLKAEQAMGALKANAERLMEISESGMKTLEQMRAIEEEREETEA